MKKRKPYSCGENLIFDNALIVFIGQFLVCSELELGGIFKKQCKLLQL
mgnify:FL=1